MYRFKIFQLTSRERAKRRPKARPIIKAPLHITLCSHGLLILILKEKKYICGQVCSQSLPLGVTTTPGSLTIRRPSPQDAFLCHLSRATTAFERNTPAAEFTLRVL